MTITLLPERAVGGRSYAAVTDAGALQAFRELRRLEGIIPALEPAHALAGILQTAPDRRAGEVLLVCLSGWGDKGMEQAAAMIGNLA